MQRDIFLSHAFEDKAVAREIASGLRANGRTVWFDEQELVLGDSLRRKISEGLAASRVGVVVLSHSFFKKEWTRWELDGLTARLMAGESNVVLPVWHEISDEDVRRFSPPLADLMAVRTSEGVEVVVAQIEAVMSRLRHGLAPAHALAAGAASLPRVSRPSVRLRRIGPFSAGQVEKLLDKLGWVRDEPPDRDTYLVYMRDERLVFVNPDWPPFRAGSPVFRVLARDLGMDEQTLLRHLRQVGYPGDHEGRGRRSTRRPPD
jgi:TIR domain-containing protein